MKSATLRSAIWLTNLILGLLVFSFFCILSTYSYYAYSLNEVFLVEFLHIEVECYPEAWMRNLKFLLAAVVNVFAFYLFWLIRKLLIHIRQYGPFEKSTVAIIEKILTWLVVYGIAELLSKSVVELLNGHLKIALSTSDLIILLLVAIIYILVEIFKYGCDIRREQKLTI